jgi:hypothetical protein
MIRIVVVIEEDSPGEIRSRGAGESVKGPATRLEIEFAETMMKAIHDISNTTFKRIGERIPLTFISSKPKNKKGGKKKDEHQDSSGS